MRPPRISIGRLMFGVALLCIPSAFAVNALNGRSLVTGNPMHDLALWPGLAGLLLASAALIRCWGKGCPFSWGFAILGATAIVGYLACCRLRPSIVDRSIQFYLNEIDHPWIVWLIDSDWSYLYAVNLLVLGLFLALPQLIMATVGGLTARWVGGHRWTST